MKIVSALNRRSWGEVASLPLADLVRAQGHVYLDDVPDGVDHLAYLERHLGPVVPQYDGSPVWSIKPQAGYDDVYHSMNTRQLTPHSECYEWPGVPPRYLALWCLTAATDGGGQTTLADVRGLLSTLSPAERGHLRSRRYRFETSAGLQRMEVTMTAEHPILTEREDGSVLFRFTCQAIADPDDFCRDFSRRVEEYFEEVKVEVDFTERSLLVWDNHQVLHSRNAFADPRRHLRRAWFA